MGCGEDGDRLLDFSRVAERPRRSSGGGMCLSVLRARCPSLLVPRPLRLAFRLRGFAAKASRVDVVFLTVLGCPSSYCFASKPISSLGVARLIRSSGDMGTGDLGDRLPPLGV